ncbi:MAG: bile acid:sodium symporter family protein [Caldisericaceae bacterium]
MKRVVNFIENNVSLVLSLGVPLGLIFPYFSFVKNYMTYLLMFVLFVTFLKMDIGDIFKHFKKPVIIGYIVLIDLIVSPIIVFFGFKVLKFDSTYLSAFLLFAALPAGVASAAMTDLTKGDTPLAILITILTHFIAPITIPLLFYVLLRKVVNLDYLSVSITMAKLIFIPLAVALVFKKASPKISRLIGDQSKILTVIPLLLIGVTVTSVNYNFIIHNPWDTIKYILLAYPVYFFFMISGYLTAVFLPLKERIAVSNTKTFNNVTIGMVLAMSFLDPKAALIITLAQIPWSTMIVPAEFLAKRSFKTQDQSLN